MVGVKRGESMKELKSLWEETKEFVDKREKEIAEKYINFLREVARAYIKFNKANEYFSGRTGLCIMAKEGLAGW